MCLTERWDFQLVGNFLILQIWIKLYINILKKDVNMGYLTRMFHIRLMNTTTGFIKILALKRYSKQTIESYSSNLGVVLNLLDPKKRWGLVTF